MQDVSPHAHASRASRVCSTCASRVQHVCTTCAPRVHLYFTGISEQWSGQGLPHYYEMITYLSLQAQIQDVRENTGAHVVHTWCTRGAHALHTCCTRGSSVGRQCVDVGAVGSGAQRQTEISGWLSHDVVLKSGLSAEREAEVASWPSDVIVQISVPWSLAVRVTRIPLGAEGEGGYLKTGPSP